MSTFLCASARGFQQGAYRPEERLAAKATAAGGGIHRSQDNDGGFILVSCGR